MKRFQFVIVAVTALYRGVSSLSYKVYNSTNENVIFDKVILTELVSSWTVKSDGEI